VNLRRPMEIDDCASISRQQNPPRPAHSRTLESFPFGLSLSLRSPLSPLSTSLSRNQQRPRGHRASEWAVERPWRRRRPSRRRACSPTGEHAAVERPGRGLFSFGRAR
jgi:hypothetical protein